MCAFPALPRLLAWLTLWLLAACSEVEPSNPYDPASPIERQATGLLTGRLKLPVDFADRGYDGFSVELGGSQALRGQGERQAEVGPEGAFTLSGVVAGTWTVSFRTPGFAVESQVVALRIGESVNLGEIPLVAALDARLEGVARLKGVADGGHAGTRIELLGTPLMATTVGDGAFSLVAAAGTYTARISHPGYAPADLGSVVLEAGASRRLSDVALSGTPGRLSGRVRFPRGFESAGDRRTATIQLIRADLPAEAPWTAPTFGTSRRRPPCHSGECRSSRRTGEPGDGPASRGTRPAISPTRT